MIVWKRKKGQSVVIGSSILCSVQRVTAPDGTDVKGAEVSLGFVAPYSLRVQRAEKYKADIENDLDFPMFYRIVQRGSDRIAGYAFELPSVADRRSDGFDYQPIAGYEDMAEADDRIELHMFSSEGEAIAYTLGLETLGDNSVAHVSAPVGNRWAVLVHFYYTAHEGGRNPKIRDHLGRTAQLEAALQQYV